MAASVDLHISDGVGVIQLDRPPMNVLNRQLQQQIYDAARQAGQQDDIYAVVIYGGPQVFAAGADIKEMAELTYQDMSRLATEFSSSLTAVAEIPKPTVAAINGYALGGGFELALCADRRIAAANAKVGQPETTLGVIPGMGGTQRLPRLIGPSKAKELIFSGRIVTADEALALGMIDEVVRDGQDVYDQALAWAKTFVNGPAAAYAAAKAAIDGGLATDLTTGLRLESQLFAAMFGTDDQKTAMRSFLTQGPGKATFVGH